MDFNRCSVRPCGPLSFTDSTDDEGVKVCSSDVDRRQHAMLIVAFAVVLTLLTLPLALVVPPSVAVHDLSSTHEQVEPKQTTAQYMEHTNRDEGSSREYWPTMVTSIRQCPAWVDQTSRLSAASRWLTDPHDIIARYAYSIDETGRRRDADSQKGRTVGLLKQGMGYGIPEWEPAWSRQSTAHTERPIDRHIDGWVRQLRQERVNNSTNGSNISPPSLAPFDDYHSTGAGDDSVNRRYAAELDRVAAYDRTFEGTFYDRAHPGHQYEGPLTETTAPWFELQLPGPPHQRFRLIFFGTEAVLPDIAGSGNATEGVISTLLMLLQSVDSEPRVIVPYPGNEKERFEELVTNLTCSFHIDLDEQLLQKRRDAGELTVDEAEYRAWLQESRAWQQQPQPIRFVHTIQASYLQCAIPAALLSSRFLLDQHPDGPILRLVGVQYQLAAQANMTAAESGFQRVSLPLCLIRTRRVHSAVMLAKSISGPPTDLLSADMLHQWLQYHLFLGMQQLHVIDRYGSLYPSLRPYLESGLLDYFRMPLLLPITIFPWQDQQLAMTVMLHATRYTADWVWEADPDEYLSFTHPYFTDNSDTVKAPHPSCHDNQAAHTQIRESTTGMQPMSSSASASEWQQPQWCQSMLGSFLSLAEQHNVTGFLLLSVVMDGWSESTQQAVQTERLAREQLQKQWSQAVQQHGALQSDVQMDVYSQRALVGRLTWADLAVSRSMAPITSVLDMYPYRMKYVDNRPKWLFSPRHVIGLKEHQVQYEPHRAERVVQYGIVHLFPQAGTSCNGTRRNTLAQLSFDSQAANADLGSTDLPNFFCADISAQSADEQIGSSRIHRCCREASSTLIRDCLVTALSNSTAAVKDAAEERRKRVAGADIANSWDANNTLTARWRLATHDPLFPRIGQLNSTQSSTLPPFFQPLPLSLAARVLHYYCLTRTDDFGKGCRQDWRGDRERKEEAEGAEAEVSTEDQAMINIRAAFRQWRTEQTQWVKRDQRLYWLAQNGTTHTANN